MKNLFVFVFLLLTTMVLFSCAKDSKNEEKLISSIDNITLADRDGDILHEYSFDRDKQMYIGESPSSNEGKNTVSTRGIVINGTLITRRVNNHGGSNYYCVTDPVDICYP